MAQTTAVSSDLIVDRLTKLDEVVTKRYPELLYEANIPEDADELDYVRLSLKGVVVA